MSSNDNDALGAVAVTQDDLSVAVLGENETNTTIVASPELTTHNTNNDMPKPTEDPSTTNQHPNNNNKNHDDDPHDNSTNLFSLTGTTPGTATTTMTAMESEPSSSMEPSSSSSQTSGSMISNHAIDNVQQQQQQSNSVDHIVQQEATVTTDTQNTATMTATTATATADATTIIGTQTTTTNTTNSAIATTTNTITNAVTSVVAASATPSQQHQQHGPKRTKRAYRKRTTVASTTTSTSHTHRDASSSASIAIGRCTTAETLPTDQTDIRTLIQTFDEQQFLVWGYEMEIERQRRTALRLQHQHEQQQSQQTSSTIPSQAQQQQNATAGGVGNQIQEGTIAVNSEQQHHNHGNLMVMDHTCSEMGQSLQQQQQLENHLQQYPNNNNNDVTDPNKNARHSQANIGDLGSATTNTSTLGHIQQQQHDGATTIGGPPPPLPPPQKLTKQELTWNQRFQELVDYKIKHGHCDVPDVGSGKLSTWVSVQRTAWKNRFWKGEKSSMSDERHTKLQNLGFRFEIKNQWETRFQQLLEYKAHHGHTRVPQHYKLQNNLGMWVKGQRAAYRHLKSGASVKTSNHHKLDTDRIQKLNDIGFEWVVKSRRSTAGSATSGGNNY